MKTNKALRICNEWFEHLEWVKKRSKRIQELAALARTGEGELARKMLQQIDNSPVVYDGGRLEPAVRALVKLVLQNARDVSQ